MANIRTLAKEILRWGVIAATGGYGVWLLVGIGHGVVRWSGDWFFEAFSLIFSLLFVGPFLAVAYFCLRRQYRKLSLVLGVIGTIVIFGGLWALPERLDVFHFMERHTREHDALAVLGLPLCLLLLFGPAYAAAWFYRFCHRLAYPGTGKRPKTRATRWLVWLGLLCMILLPMIHMLITLNSIMQTPKAPSTHDSFGDSIGWFIGPPVVGGLLMFLGLIRRRPISEASRENSSPEPA